MSALGGGLLPAWDGSVCAYSVSHVLVSSYRLTDKRRPGLQCLPAPHGLRDPSLGGWLSDPADITVNFGRHSTAIRMEVAVYSAGAYTPQTLRWRPFQGQIKTVGRGHLYSRPRSVTSGLPVLVSSTNRWDARRPTEIEQRQLKVKIGVWTIIQLSFFQLLHYSC